MEANKYGIRRIEPLAWGPNVVEGKFNRKKDYQEISVIERLVENGHPPVSEMTEVGYFGGKSCLIYATWEKSQVN